MQLSRPRRRTFLFGTAIAAVLASAAGFVRWTDSPVTPAAVTAPAVATTTVTRADISTGRSLPGALGYGPARKVSAGRAGVITWLPAAGATITRGHTAYSVNDEPVPLFYGKIPFFRDLQAQGSVGRDVRVVADNLRALGYAVGSQPSPGTVVTRTVAPSAEPAVEEPSSAAASAAPQPSASPRATVVRETVREGEGVLTADLIKAVKAWQKDTDLPVEGRLVLGSVLVLPGPVRVSALSAQVGDAATGELFAATATSKVIVVQAGQGEAAAVDNGDRATVRLSDGTTTTARVSAVGTALQASEGADPKLAITLTLDEPAKFKGVDAADLQVAFATQTHRQVLTVAVGALLALSEGGYAVQTPSGALIAVQTGIFAKGRVEVSGTGVTEGLTVVTTS